MGFLVQKPLLYYAKLSLTGNIIKDFLKEIYIYSSIVLADEITNFILVMETRHQIQAKKK